MDRAGAYYLWGQPGAWELGAAAKMIGCYDVIVAATALERGSQVATFNPKHFSSGKQISAD